MRPTVSCPRSRCRSRNCSGSGETGLVEPGIAEELEPVGELETLEEFAVTEEFTAPMPMSPGKMNSSSLT